MNYELFQLINNLAKQHGWLDQLMIFFAKDAVLLFVLVLLFLWFRDKNNTYDKRTVVYSLLGAVVAIVLNTIIGALYYHPRPFVDHQVHKLIDHDNSSSFPSDHAAFSFGLALPILMRKSPSGRLAVVLAFLIGFARVFVGVHYPLDIIGGFVTALIGALFVVKVKVVEPVVRLIMWVYAKITSKIPFLALSDEAMDQEGFLKQ